MRYLFLLFFITGCAALQKEVNRDRYHFNTIMNESVDGRETIDKYIKNPSSFEGWNSDFPKGAASRIGRHQNAFESLCKEGDQEACDELKLGQEAVKAYEVKVVEIKKSETELNEAKKKVEAEKYEAEQKIINERNQRYEAIGGNDLKNICIGEGNIKHFNRVISEQRSIGKESGVVNQTALYQAGQGLITWRKILAESKVEYKKKMKKEFQPAACKQLENN